MGFFRKSRDEKGLKGGKGESQESEESALQKEKKSQQVQIKVPNDKTDTVKDRIANDDKNASSFDAGERKIVVEDWDSNSFKRHDEKSNEKDVQNVQAVQSNVSVQNGQESGQNRQIGQGGQNGQNAQGSVQSGRNVELKGSQNKIKNDNHFLSLNLNECAVEKKETVEIGKESVVRGNQGKVESDGTKKSCGLLDKALQDRRKIAYLPIYYDIFDLNGKTYGKLVRCYIDNSNKIVGFTNGVEDFETENINVAGYVFADRSLSKILSNRYLNVKMANLDAYLGHLRMCGKSAESDFTYNKVKNHFIKISNEYLRREAKGFNFEELNAFNIDFGRVMSSKDSEILESIMKMKLKYKQYNFDKQNGKNNRLNSGKTGKNANGCDFLTGGGDEEKYRNYMPLFCVLEEDYSLSTVSIYCEWFKNGNVAFEQGFEITKGFDIDRLGNIYEDKDFENQLNERDYIVGRLKNLNNAYRFMKNAMIEAEKKERVEKAIYKCEDLVNSESFGESFGNYGSGGSGGDSGDACVCGKTRANAKANAVEEGCECEKIEFAENFDCVRSCDDEQACEDSEIEALIDSGKIEAGVNVGEKVYGAIAETKKAFYLIAKKFLDMDTSFEREKDNLNATLITNQLPQIPMSEVCENILEFRDRIDFITDKTKGVKVPRPKRQSLGGCQKCCKVFDFNTINKEDIRII